MDISEFLGSIVTNIGGVPPISQAYVNFDGSNYHDHGPTGVNLLSATTDDDAKDEASAEWIAGGYKRISAWFNSGGDWYCYVI